MVTQNHLQRIHTFLICMMFINSYAQELHIYSIKRERQLFGDNDYTLDGPNMQVPRKRLLDPLYYGPEGIYKKSIRIHDTFSVSNSFTGIRAIGNKAIFFFGGFDANNGSLQKFTKAELDSFYRWTRTGGKVIFTGGLNYMGMVDYTYMNHRYGFETALGTSEQLIGDPYNPDGTPFNGPFGPVTPVFQGGGAQGYYTKLPESSKVLATDQSGRPTLLMDCSTMDILVPDVDVFTALNREHSYQNFGNPDRFLGNTIAFLDNLPDPPLIQVNDLDLKVQTGYKSYQWFHDDEPVSGANSNSFKANRRGTYYVEVEVPGGCRVKSEPFIDGGLSCEPFVPLAFSPDGNDTNDKACVYGYCLNAFEFRIFDRWGQMVFSSESLAACWDGTFRGKKLAAGTYAWALIAEGENGHKVKRSGSITLVR